MKSAADISANAIARAIIAEEADRRSVVYLREVDPGTDNACWVVCAKGDPGAIAFRPVA